jgi:hypothetical protein
MDVHEEGGGLPAAKLLDGIGVDAIEVHRHGSTGSEGVAADVAGGVSKIIEAYGLPSILQGLVDVLGSDAAPCGAEGVEVVVDAVVQGPSMGQHVVDTTGQGFDGTVVGAGAFLVDALAFDPIFLVWHSDGGLSSS